MMKFGKEYNFGDIILAEVQFTDTFEVKRRPALVLFEEYGNIITCGITSNPQMKGISLTKKDGAKVNSIIKLNYIFTISENMVLRQLFSISKGKKREIKEELMKKLILS
jgi:mRNA interferase MazF